MTLLCSEVSMLQKCSILCLFLSLFILFPLSAEPVDTAIVRRMLEAVSDSNLTSHITTLGEAGGYYNRISFTPGNTAAVNYIGGRMRSLPGLAVVNDTFYVSTYPPPYNGMPLVNILGTIRGSTAPEKYVIVGAHLDCSASRMDPIVWKNTWQTIRTLGADDNASGVAAVLECARILTDPGFNYKPDYSVIFAAWGNEEGIPETVTFPGSAHFANDALASGKQILGFINIDMIGYNPLKIYADIFSNPASQWIGQASLAVNAKYGLGITTNQMPFVNAGYSDHVSFWTAGYPAIMIIEHAFPWTSDDNYTASPHYHRSSDTLGTLNPSLLKALTKLSLGTLISMAEKTATSVATPMSVPNDFVLEQNYPNPFNPATQFRFSLRNKAHIRLTVHDVLGRITARPVDQTVEAGTHQVGWNASEVPAGVYFYTLTVGKNAVTKKLVVEK
jgi:hypothetical protein